MRIGGLASGIDTDSIIRDMMQAHRIPLNKITQKKQFMEWQLDDYREANRDIRSMRDDLFDMTRQSTFMAKTVSVSNENAVGIRALNANSELSGTLQVHQLAKAATWQSVENKGLNERDDISKVFGDAVDGKHEITIQVPGEGSKERKITLEEGTTIKEAISKINKESDVNVFFDEYTGKIAMTSKSSGAGDIQISVNDVDITADESIGKGAEGQNADFTFNGLRTERESNTFQINGFEITLKEVTSPYTGEAAEGEVRPVEDSGSVTFSSTPDVDKVFDSIKGFVDDYNELIEKLNGKVKEPLHRDYQPLSEEEKAEMKEKEIELWEEKAMSGTLRNDPTIQSLLQRMRTDLMGTVETSTGEKMNLSSIGITTSKNYLANGKLELNEEKLREAISENPNNIYELFAGTDESTGIIPNVRTSLGDANKAITTRAGSVGSGNDSFTLGRSIKQMDKDIERFEARMEKMEERYWRQFSAMENAMQKANAQAEQLMNALGGMGGMM